MKDLFSVHRRAPMASPTFTVECRAGTIELRVFHPSDVTGEYVDWMNDPEVVRYTFQTDKLHSVESVTRYTEEQLASEEAYFFGIFHEGTHIGNINLEPFAGREGCAEVSYVVGRKEYWNKGVGSAAVKAVTDFALGEIGYVKVLADPFVVNPASIKVLEKAGFAVEGRFSGKAEVDGEPVDQVMMGREAD